MRVLIAGSVSPFSAREEIHWVKSLTSEIHRLHHEVDNFILPAIRDPLMLSEQILAYRLLDIQSTSDLLITVGYPAFVLQHPNKKVILFSLSSLIDDYYDTEYGILSTPQYQRIRKAIAHTQQKCLAEASEIYTGSSLLTSKLFTDLNIPSTHYLFDDANTEYNASDFSDSIPWVVCETTLEPDDRIDLLLESTKKALKNWKLLIYVSSASDVYRQALLQRIDRMELGEKVVVTDGAIPIKMIKKASLFIALPINTNRIPESVIRTIKTNTPIMTTTDSGAILEIASGDHHIIVEPSAGKISNRIDQYITNHFQKRISSGGNTQSRKQIQSVADVVNRILG